MRCWTRVFIYCPRLLRDSKKRSRRNKSDTITIELPRDKDTRHWKELLCLRRLRARAAYLAVKARCFIMSRCPVVRPVFVPCQHRLISPEGRAGESIATCCCGSITRPRAIWNSLVSRWFTGISYLKHSTDLWEYYMDILSVFRV